MTDVKKRLDELAQLPFVHGKLQDLGTLEDMERGLATRVDVEYFTGMLTWRAVAGHPLVSLVETLKLSGNPLESIDDVARLVLHPDARRLRRILAVNGEDRALDAALPGFHREGQTLVRS